MWTALYTGGRRAEASSCNVGTPLPHGSAPTYSSGCPASRAPRSRLTWRVLVSVGDVVSAASAAEFRADVTGVRRGRSGGRGAAESQGVGTRRAAHAGAWLCTGSVSAPRTQGYTARGDLEHAGGKGILEDPPWMSLAGKGARVPPGSRGARQVVRSATGGAASSWAGR